MARPLMIGRSVVRHRAAAAVLWTPANLATAPMVSLDPSDSTSFLTTAGAFAGLKNKLGIGGNAVQVGSSPLPVPTAKAINGLTALKYGGQSSTTGQNGMEGTLSYTGAPLGLFAVCQHVDTTNSSYGRPFSLGATANDYNSATCLCVQRDNTNNGINFLRNFSGQTMSFPSGGVPFFLGLTFDGTNGGQLYINAVADSALGGSGGAWNFTRYRSGNAYGGYNPNEDWEGLIGEQLILGYAPSASDRAKIEGYLAWKWGLQTYLPAGHAYASRPPYVSDP